MELLQPRCAGGTEDRTGHAPVRLSRLLAAVALLTSLGCAARDPVRLPTRLIAEEEPTRQLVPGSFTEFQTAFVWDFRSAEAIEGWSTRNIDGRFEIEDGALVVASTSDDPFLFRDIDIAASSVDVVQVAMDEPTPTPAVLFWARRGEEFAPERSVVARMLDEPSPLARFEVGGHPAWAGRIARLRLDPTATANEQVRIERIEGLTGYARPDRLATIVASPWRVDLGHETRSARLAATGEVLRVQLAIPPAGAELRFATGLWREVVDAREDAGAISLRGFIDRPYRVRRRIFEERIELADAVTGSWSDHVVDLSSYGGSQVELVLEAHADGELDPRRALAVWTEPAVVGRQVPAERAPTVVLISIDTLRADRLSLYGYERATSPAIDAWANSSAVTFDTAVAQAPWTLPSHTSMLTGLDALRHGANYSSARASPWLTTLAEVFRTAGYRTVGITGGGFMDPQFGLAQGFERYWHAPRDSAEDARRELEVGVDRVLRELGSGDPRPLFLFLHSYDVHMPYFARQPHFDRWAPRGTAHPGDLFINSQPVPAEPGNGFTRSTRLGRRSLQRPMFRPIVESDLPVVRALYDSGIAHMDEQLGRLFRALEELELQENTLVVFTSDHGELFGEHGLFGHSSLYDANLLVPLVFSWPGRLPEGLRVPHQVRSIDIFPTILELAGVDSPHSDGTSLFPLMTNVDAAEAPDEAWSYAPFPGFGVSVRTLDDLKFIYNDTPWPGRRGPEELYRVNRDPDEMINVLEPADEVALASLRRRVTRRLDEVAGLRVTLFNSGSVPFTGRLDGPMGIDRVKAVLVPCACVRPEQNRRLSFELPPGMAVTLRLENLIAEELLATATLGDSEHEPVLRIDLAMPPEAPGLVFVLDGSVWREADGEAGDSGAGIKVWWTGLRPAAGDDPEMDPRVLRQLKALGYIR